MKHMTCTTGKLCIDDWRIQEFHLRPAGDHVLVLGSGTDISGLQAPQNTFDAQSKGQGVYCCMSLTGQDCHLLHVGGHAVMLSSGPYIFGLVQPQITFHA